MFKPVLLAAMLLPLGGCCIISCNGRLPNSFIKVNSSIQADCTYEDRLGVRKFTAPGEELGMPKNDPGKLTCQAKGYKPYAKTFLAQDWSPLTPLSGDSDAMRYYLEVDLILERMPAEAAK
jgi:hypothetical protein